MINDNQWMFNNFVILFIYGELQAASTVSENRLAILTNRVPSSNLINHSIVFPKRLHFPKTCRRLPQVIKLFNRKRIFTNASLINYNYNDSIPIQALIIGIRKCGTRALLEMLYLHPMIQKAAGEVHFFDRDENYLKGLEWYRKKMPQSFRGQITIEKSPSYFVTPEVSTVYKTL